MVKKNYADVFEIEARKTCIPGYFQTGNSNMLSDPQHKQCLATYYDVILSYLGIMLVKRLIINVFS